MTYSQYLKVFFARLSLAILIPTLISTTGCVWRERMDTHRAKQMQKTLDRREQSYRSREGICKSNPPEYLKEYCELISSQNSEGRRQLKEMRCLENAFQTDGGIFRSSDYIPIVGAFTKMDRTMNLMTENKYKTLSENGKSVYHACMTKQN